VNKDPRGEESGHGKMIRQVGGKNTVKGGAGRAKLGEQGEKIWGKGLEMSSIAGMSERSKRQQVRRLSPGLGQEGGVDFSRSGKNHFRRARV